MLTHISAFVIAAIIDCADTAPGNTVMFFGVAPVTGMTTMPGVPVSPSVLASASFFSSAGVKFALPTLCQPVFAAARSMSSFVSSPSLLPVA